MPNLTQEEIEKLKALALAAKDWEWNAVEGDQFGLKRDGEFYDIGTVDADQYATGDQALNETVLNFIAAFDPKTVLSILAAAVVDAAQDVDIQSDRGYINGMQEGWRLCAAGEVEKFHATIKSMSDAIRQARAEYRTPPSPAVEGVSGWISVDDRLPSSELLPNGRAPVVLVQWREGELSDNLSQIDVCNTVSLWANVYRYSHWMPLPAAPIRATPDTKEQQP